MVLEPSIRVRLHKYPNRPYGLIWAAGRKGGEISAGTTDRREAERAAGRLEAQLLDGQLPTSTAAIAMTWEAFSQRYKDEWLDDMSYGSKKGWEVAAKKFKEICNPKLLTDIDKSMLSKFRAALEKSVSANSARSYYRALRAGLGWAESVDLIDHVPKIRHRKAGKQSSVIRTRTITAEEFDRIVTAIPELQSRKFKKDAGEDLKQIQDFAKGLWYSGLRIDELNRLRWEPTASLHVDLTGKLPLIVMLGAQKNRSDCYLPAPKEFWELITKPGRLRTGLVFPVKSRRGGDQMTTRHIGRYISKAGSKAGVVVDPRSKKCATAHDLRAAYLTRVASVVTMSQAQALARHSDPKTTSQFYVRHQAEELAKAAGWK